MKTRRKDLINNLEKVIWSIDKNPTLDILACVKISINDNVMSITGGDMSTFSISKMDIDSEDKEFAVNAFTLEKTLKAMNTDEVKLTVEENRLVIVCGRSRAKLPLEDIEDYPELPEISAKRDNNILGLDLKAAINQTINFLSDDEVRLAMTGVHIVGSGDISFEATNAHILSVVTKQYDGVELDYIETSKTLRGIGRLIGKSNVEVQFGREGDWTIYEIDNTTIYSRSYDATFPNIDAVIPEGSSYNLIVNRKELINKLKLAKVFANETTNAVEFNFSENMCIKAKDIDHGRAGQAEMEYDSKSEIPENGIKVGFSEKYLQMLLNNIDDEEVVLEVYREDRPVIIRSEDILMLIMPIIIRNG